MASTFYETLGVPSTATQDEIRKAYKRRALQTHPDRLGPGLTPEQKQAAEEAFREVTAAYEVLFDPEQRALYDRHGEWPPQEPLADAGPHASGSRTSPHPHNHPGFSAHPFFGPTNAFPDPFAGFFPGGPFGGPFAPPNHPTSPHHPFVFSDPFDLFRQMFGDPHSVFDNDPFFARDPLFMGPRPAPRPPAGSLFTDPFFPHPMVSVPSRSGGYNISESFTQRTINGRTETIRTRQDGQGNVHVKRTGPDGRTLYTINGVEAIEGGDSRRPMPALDPPPPLAPANLMAHPVMPQHQRHRGRAQTAPASALPDYATRPYPSYARTPLPYPTAHGAPMSTANNPPAPPHLGAQGHRPIHGDNQRKWWKWN